MYTLNLGVSLVTLTPEPTEEVMRALAQSRVATLELNARMFTDQSRRQQNLDVVKKWTVDAHLSTASVHALFGTEYDLSAPDEEARRLAVSSVIDTLGIAHELGAGMVVVHGSAEPIEAEERQQRLMNCAGSLADLYAECRRTGVRIAVELLPRTCLGNTTEELLDMRNGLDDRFFGVCLDTNHLMDRPETLPDVVSDLGDTLMTLHVSDYDGVDEQHLLPGKGVLDWPAFAAALQRNGYSGPFNYESTIEGESLAEKIAALEENYADIVG